MTRNVKRRYSSPRREQQAEETRRAIVAAAIELFSEQGYAATSIRNVAERASVAEQTVYNVFGDKVGLLASAASDYIGAAGGPDEATLIAALSAEPDPIERIRMAARDSRATWESGALELELMLFGQELRDRRLVELREQGLAYKVASTRAVCEILFPDTIRRRGIELDDIAAFAVAVDSAATVTTVTSLGWTMDRWEAWIAQLLTLFLDPGRITKRAATE